MSHEVSVHLLPALFEPAELHGGIAVMIDVLRASTTICHALDAGAPVVVPCQDVDDARQIAANHSAGEVLLGGERDGTLIEGFDLDNSPQKYTADKVRNRTIVFTTTNGTRALLRSREADRIVIGAFVNVNAVIRMLADDPRPVHLVCAGTNGHVTAEDVLCAGAIATGLELARGRSAVPNDQTQMAMDVFSVRSQNRTFFEKAIRTGLGGRNLQELGFDEDVRTASTWDLFNLVPEYSAETGQIRAACDISKERRPRWLAAPV